MKVAGILILTFAVQINSIVCSAGWEQPLLPRKLALVSAEKLSGVYILSFAGGISPAKGRLIVVMRGDDVIGRIHHYMIQPIFNEAHHIITKNVVTGSIEEISDEQAQKLGVFTYWPGAPRRYRSRSPPPRN